MKRILAFTIIFVVTMSLALPALADLCPKCKNLVYPMAIGKCTLCGGDSTSIAFKLCKACSARLNQCERCRATLKSDTPTTEPAAAKKPPLQLNASNNGKAVTVHVGRQIQIRLAGNPTTGFTWVAGGLTGDAVEQVGEPQYLPTPVNSHIVGSGGTFIFVFRAVKAGESQITLQYKRSWETVAPAQTFCVTVKVQPSKAKSGG